MVSASIPGRTGNAARLPALIVAQTGVRLSSAAAKACLDALAEHETESDLLVRPQTDHAAGTVALE
jgi:hypothetical protein